MSQYGIEPYGGELGPYGGAGLITLLGVLPAAENRFIVVFDRAPLSTDPKGRRDASNPANYRIEPIDPTIVINNIPTVPDKAVVPTRGIALARARVDPADPKQIHVWTDRDMEPNIQHRISIVGPIHGMSCEDFAGPPSDTFWAPNPAPLPIAPDRLDGSMRDLDDGGTAASGDYPEVWRYQDNSDIALQDEIESLKKRIIRRVTQLPNSYVWSDNGVPTFIHSLMTPAALNNLAIIVAEQTRKDALVSAASCEVTPFISGGDAYVVIRLSVILRDRRDLVISYKLPTK